MKQIYNKELKTSDLIDDMSTPPEGWTDQAPRWTMYEAWDYVNDCWGESFDLIKKAKKSEIVQSFDKALSDGKFMSTVLEIEVDYRRGANKNDMQNLQTLISYMKRNSISETVYKGYEEDKTCSVSDLEVLLTEMEDYGLYLYQKKWQLEQDAAVCNNKEELDKIVW